MKKAVTFMLAAASLFAARAEVSTNRARSVHLHFAPVAERAAGLRGSVKVTQTQTNSFFSIINCDRAYCGIQDLGAGGRVFIFSVWDPGDQFDFRAKEDAVAEDKQAKVLFLSPGTKASRFGGEGTGAKTITDIGWNVGDVVTAQIDAEADGSGRTAFTCTIKVGENGGMWKLATISTVGEMKPIGNPFSSFIEDFWRTPFSAGVVRRAEFSNYASRSAGSTKWVPAESAVFTADQLPALNIDAGKADSGAFFLQTGGDTKNEHVKIGGTIK